METRETELGFLAVPDRGQGGRAERDPADRDRADRDPADGAGSPGVVVVHDVWGLADHTRDVARRFAEAGFAALAVDLYRSLPDVAITDPGAWMRELSDPDALEILARAAHFLGSDPCTRAPVGHHGIGVVGFCMGGTYALMAGCALDGFAAAVPFYGLLSHEHGLLHAREGLDPVKKPRSPLALASELRCPLLGFFGAADPYVPLADVEALRGQLAASGQPSAEVVVFEGAGHAFMNDTRPDAYHPEAAQQAWQRMLAFLETTLRARGAPVG